MAEQSLSLALLVDSDLVTAWLGETLRDLGKGWTVACIVVLDSRAPLTDPARQVMERERAGRRHLDAFAPADLPAGVPVIAAATDAEAQAALAPRRADVILDLRDRPDPAAFAGLARRGGWCFRHAAADPSGAIPGDVEAHFRAVWHGLPSIGAELLCHRSDGSGALVLYRTESVVSDRSVATTRNAVCWKQAAMLRRCLEGLAANGPALFFARAEERFGPSSLPALPAAGSLKGFRNRLLSRRMLMPFSIVRHQWRIGVRRRGAKGEAGDPPWGSREWARGFRFLQAPEGRFWADPFLFEHQGKTWLFFEDWSWQAGRACLSCAELHDDAGLGPTLPVLDKPYHLSNPLVFAADGEIFLVPETGEARRVEIYRSTGFPTEWTLHSTALDGLEIYDPCPVRLADGWWLFGAVADRGGIGWDELAIWRADRLEGPWRPHADVPALSDVRAARPGGRVVQRQGMLLRYAQDCSSDYGSGLGLYRIDELTHERFRQTRIAAIDPFDFRMNGVHAYDATDRFEVIDARRYQLNVRGTVVDWMPPYWLGRH